MDILVSSARLTDRKENHVWSHETLAGGFSASALLFAGLAAPAGAQQQGLVNVNIENVANDTQVAITVPINAAANICGVDVNVLTAFFDQGGQTFVDCRARGNQNVTVSER